MKALRGDAAGRGRVLDMQMKEEFEKAISDCISNFNQHLKEQAPISAISGATDH